MRASPVSLLRFSLFSFSAPCLPAGQIVERCTGAVASRLDKNLRQVSSMTYVCR